MLADGLERGLDAVAEGRDRHFDLGATLLLLGCAIEQLVLALPLGDVVMRRHPAAAWDGPVGDRDQAPLDLDHVAERLVAADRSLDRGYVGVDIAHEVTAGAAGFE